MEQVVPVDTIETAILTCAGVRAAAVVIDRDPMVGLRLIAYVVAASASAATDIRAALAGALSPQGLPLRVVAIHAMPLIASGEVDRDALTSIYGEAIDFTQPFVAPRTPDERALGEIWCEVFGIREVGIDDDFFDLGGYSLLALRLSARAAERLGVEISLETLFEYSTIRLLAEWITVVRCQR